MSTCVHQEAFACAMPMQNDLMVDAWGEDMEQLAQILRDCHLHEEVPGTQAPHSASSSASPGRDPALDVVGPWAEELVLKLQSCISPLDARALCAEALLAFHQKHANESCTLNSCPTAERLKKLQSANKVIVRALRSFSMRQSEMQKRCQQAEEANAQLVEQLRQCQEQLRASERAKDTLQSHLQLMNSRTSEAVHLSHFGGPPCL